MGCMSNTYCYYLVERKERRMNENTETIGLSETGHIWQIDVKITDHHITILPYRNHIPHDGITLTRREVLNLACLLPEIKALIKWAFNVRETMSDADLFPHGVEELKPFIGKEIE